MQNKMEAENQTFRSKTQLKNILQNAAFKNELAADMRCSRAKMLLAQMDANGRSDGRSDFIVPKPKTSDPTKPADQVGQLPALRSSRGKQMHICARFLPQNPGSPPSDEAFSMCTGKRKVLDAISAFQQSAVVAHDEHMPLQNVTNANGQVELQAKQEQLMPDSETDYLLEWLEKTAHWDVPEHNSRHKAAAEKAAPECPASHSDDGELRTQNPFGLAAAKADKLSDAGVADQVTEDFGCSENLRSAFPESCVTDAILMLDRAKHAVRLDCALPPLNVQDCCRQGDLIRIAVCKVYSPFQFWFHFQHPTGDFDPLVQLTNEMNSFYTRELDPAYRSAMPSSFHKAGYICAAQHGSGDWRRARVLHTAPIDATWVYVYHVDYATSVELPPCKLRFLPDHFANTPIQAARGTLSHIQPLGIHWPPDSVSHFKRLVYHRTLHAEVIEVDAAAGILFMRLSQSVEFAPSINKLLVEAGFAAISENYSRAVIAYNCGRRLRYLRERLPSFEILESRIIPLNDEEFEQYFDAIIYCPSFHSDFQLPQLQNPFRSGLLEALAAWMPAYRREQEHWLRIYKQADMQLLEARRQTKKKADSEAQAKEVLADPGGQVVQKAAAKQEDAGSQQQQQQQQQEEQPN
ncbi:uncharacterized protein LOC120454958 isoform X1 [Drosophila santomea]|uniref:uncharacterized protein LOC120454958 isoform X1 n=1 Tax=Drosophila santomea TaxID=129105 RepID=UPI00195461DE|nr:uncharacterized protein LOC120454958 isoform X1 [Drosophila santomea]